MRLEPSISVVRRIAERSRPASRRRGLRMLTGAALVASLLLAAAAPAQGATLVSETTWGGADSEGTSGIAIASDGSTYLAGLTTSFDPFGQVQLFLVKFAPDDSLEWQRTWEGPQQFSNDEARDVAVGPDGSVYVTGTAFGDVVLLKFSLEGSLVWQRRWDGGGAGEGVAVDVAGSIYVVGATGAGSGSLLVLKFAPDGSIVWQKTWGGPARGDGVAVGSDGNIYVAGSTSRPDGSGGDAIVLKLDPAGALLMQKAYSASEFADARGGIAVAADGSIYLAGALQESTRKVVVDALLVKLAPDGSLVWDRSWGGRSGDVSGGVAIAPDGMVQWAGNSNSFGAGSDDAFLLHMSPDGKAMDSNTWGGAGTDHADGVEVAPDGTTSLGGTTETPPYSFLRAPTKTPRPRGTVATPTAALSDASGTVSDAGGTVATPTGTTPGAGGFDAALVKIAT